MLRQLQGKDHISSIQIVPNFQDHLKTFKNSVFTFLKMHLSSTILSYRVRVTNIFHSSGINQPNQDRKKYI